MLTSIGVGFYSLKDCWVFGDTSKNVDEVKSTFFIYFYNNFKNQKNEKTTFIYHGYNASVRMFIYIRD